MAYTTAAKVDALTPQLALGAATRVTTTDVADFIADVDAEINVALLSVGYSAPYTDAGAFLTWLGKVATDGVAARVYKAWFMDTSGGASQGQGHDLSIAYREGLAAIRNRTMVPVSLGEATASLPRGFSSDSAAAVITMDTVF